MSRCAWNQNTTSGGFSGTWAGTWTTRRLWTPSAVQEEHAVTEMTWKTKKMEKMTTMRRFEPLGLFSRSDCSRVHLWLFASHSPSSDRVHSDRSWYPNLGFGISPQERIIRFFLFLRRFYHHLRGIRITGLKFYNYIIWYHTDFKDVKCCCCGFFFLIVALNKWDEWITSWLDLKCVQPKILVRYSSKHGTVSLQNTRN